jgi:hypothetical protein
MNRLIKTRKLLRESIDKDRLLQIGPPIKDVDIDESINEMKDLEFKCFFYRIGFFIMLGTTLGLLFNI